MPSYERKYPIGAEVMPSGGVHFRVWAPASKTVAVELIGGNGHTALTALNREANGYFSGEVPEAAAGLRYRLRVEGGAFPDPASRFQPKGRHAFVLRFFSAEGDRLLVVNLGGDLHRRCAPEPLLAPVAGRGWRVEWSSEALAYGGRGVAPLETRANWMLPAEAAVLLVPDENADLPAVRLSEND